MATKRPSFLKRQKELKRTARALEKREARKERKDLKPTEPEFDVLADPSAEPAESIQDTKF